MTSTEIVTASSLHRKGEECWDLVNEIEQAWTDVEKTDRTIIYEHVPQSHLTPVIAVCLPSYTITES